MSLKNRNKANGGFTIIEVLIVLAIAGLILLIVFLAVPALNRNSRNTTAKNDAQNVLGGISEYQGANNGKLPTDVKTTGAGGDVTYGPATTTKISIQGTTSVKTVTADATYDAAAATGTGNTINTGIIGVYPGRQCVSGAATTTANVRSVAIFYTIETSSSPTVQCVS